MKRFASTRSENRASQPVPGRAQWSVGSIDDDGIRYGLTIHALIASTIAIAPTIVTVQSTRRAATRGPRWRGRRGCANGARSTRSRSACSSAPSGSLSCASGSAGARLRSTRRRARPRPRASGSDEGGLRRQARRSVTPCSAHGSPRAATRRSARGRRRGGRRALASRGTRPGGCSAGTRGRRRARPRSSRRAAIRRCRARPGSSRAIASTSTIAGSSPPESTYGPDRDRVRREVLRRCARRSPRSATRAARACSSAASSSRRLWSSGRPCGVSATTRRRDASIDGVERGGNDVDAQNHPRAAAVGLVIDLSAPERREVAVVEEPQVELRTEHGRPGGCSVSQAKA